MTSQHFADDGWDSTWNDNWGDQNSGEANNNNSSKVQQQPPVNQPFISQPMQQPPPVSNTPLYSPFAYSQPNVPMPVQQPIPMPIQQPIPPATSQPHIQQQYGGNPVNFFNPSTHFSDSANNNQMNAFMQSPISSPTTTMHSSFNVSPAQPMMNNFSNFHNDVSRTETNTSVVPNAHQQNPISYESPSYPPPPPVMSTYDSNQHMQDVKNLNYNATPPQMLQHQPTPPPPATTAYQQQNQYSQWADQQRAPMQNNEMYNMQNQYQSWQAPSVNPNVFSHQQPVAASSNSSNDWERISPDAVQFLQQQTNQTNESFASQPPKKVEEPPMFTASPQMNQIQQAKIENVENIQMPAAEIQSSFNMSPSFIPTVDHYENRERLDEVPPLRPPSSSSSIDRHNYLVTGQLSSESTPPQYQQHNIPETLPPPGLSRMVVGEPESNQEQVMPSAHRMVTGNEMTPASYMNYQRQADGEAVSQTPPMNVIAPLRPPSHPPFPHHEEQPASMHQSPQQQNYNVGDRNLYLVAGESNMNSQQRVIPGVESDHSINNLPSIINPLQNLHIEDDDDFVNISVSSQHRNVDGDGMEEQEIQQRPTVETTEQREEDIEGANDNNVENAAISMPIPPNEHELLEIREDIEGANDPNEPLPPPVKNESEKKTVEKKRQESSEDSEVREVERNAKSKPRRSKKYDSNYSDSENDDDYRKRDKYDDRYKKANRDRMTREEYEKYRRREKERRSGGNSRYGESRRRTDDDEEDSKKKKDKSRRSDHRDDAEGSDYREKRKEKRREGESRKAYDERDRRERRKRGERYYEDPSGRDSRNTSDREFDRYSRHSRGGAYDQAYQGYGYDPYSSYYQQQQYFEMLRRTNPQAYEWYKNYYGTMVQQQQQQQVPVANPLGDIGGSLRSGYSSSNEKDRESTNRFLPGGTITNPLRSLNTSFVDGTDYRSLQTSFQPIGSGFNQTYPSSSLNFNQNYGYDMYNDLRPKQDVVPSGRSTPRKFQCIHGYVKLANGLMATIDTLNNDDRYLLKIENVPIYDRNRRLYQSYPGPLVRGVSHKKTVIEFCEDKLKHNSHVESSLRASHALLWSYLILMLRQNGTYTEADISELLMKNSDDFKNTLETSVAEHTEEVGDDNTDVSESEEPSEKNSNTASQSHETSHSQNVTTEKNVLDKFKSYLLYGNINDALDYATDNNLWGHALFLASKVDRRQHANVMLKFANKLSYNDPLQTLYQIMSGRMPACVSNLDDKWGDWRPHLAMIISNCTDKPELVKRSIITLGDSLASRGDIYGSQFCYLLMDPQFTDYSDSAGANGKIGLLGTSLQKPFKEFATDDSIIMTEVYEYARSLSAEGYFIAPLQKYKFLLATNILDYGMQLKCLLYMEQIAKCVAQRSDLFEMSFVSKIYSLGDRLKFYDPVMERAYEEGDNSENQKWLQDLYAVMESYGGIVQTQQPPAVPAYSTNEIYTPTEYQQQQPQTTIPTGIYDPMSQHTTPIHAPTPLTQQPSYEEDQTDQQSQVIYNPDYSQNQQINSYPQNVSMRRESLSQIQEQQTYFQPTYNDHTYSQQDTFSYSGYGQGYQQQQPVITLGNAASKKYEDTPEDSSEQKRESPVKKQEPEKTAKKTSPSQDASGSWFGGLFNKLKMKSNNQMILPDDKNPAIVWDEANKKWINKDEDATETESFKPPPKMGEMMGMAQQQQQIPQQQSSQPPMMQTNQYQQSQQPMMMNSMPTGQPMMNSMPAMQQAVPMNSMQQGASTPAMQQTQIPSMQQGSPMNNMQQGGPMNNMQQGGPMNNMQQGAPVNSMQQAPMQSMPQGGPMNSMQQAPMPSMQTQNQADQPAPPAAPNMFKMQKSRNLKKSYVDILGNAGKTIPSQANEVAPPQMDMQYFNPQAQQPQGMQFYNPNDFN